MQKISVIGIDLAKDSFAVCAMTKSGKVLKRKVMSRKTLREFLIKQKDSLVAFEACGGSHYWARFCQGLGLEVKMMSPQRVKPFAPPQKKNDQSDAEAICLAALSESVPSVRTKTEEQQDIDAYINYRELLIKQRVQLVNQAHALALEFGAVMAKNKSVAKLKEALEDATNKLTEIAREMIDRLLEGADQLNQKALETERKLQALLQHNDNYKLLKSVPGVGLITAAAILAHTGGSVASFKNGRQFSAYLGLTPRQYSTGGKTKLVGITGCGESMIRKLLVVGTTSVMRVADKKSDRVSQWATAKREQLGYRKASVALANKTARIVYGVMKSQQPYQTAA